MRIFLLAVLAVISTGTIFAGSTQASAQSSDSRLIHNKVLGYQDQVTGTFHPFSTIAPDATITPTTGTIELTLTITLRTALPKGGGINCAADLSASSESLSPVSLSSWLEESYSEATVSGSTATCNVVVPYSWQIPAASSTVLNTFSGSYYIEMAKAPGAAPGASGTIRLSNGPYLGGPIPASGTTTKISQSVTI